MRKFHLIANISKLNKIANLSESLLIFLNIYTWQKNNAQN